VLCKKSNYIVEYKREPSKRLSKKQLHISKSCKKGKAVKDYAESSYKMRATALMIDT